MANENLLNQDPDQVTIDESKDYLSELVGEGKKFADHKALAKGKAYSDAHITILERRFDELSDEYRKLKEDSSAGAKLQDLLDKLETTQQQLASRETNPNSNEDTKPALKLDDVESLIDSRMSQRELSRREESNYNQVKAKLTERYGTNYGAALKEYIQTEKLDLTDEDVNQMARRNPNLFIKTFGLNEQTGENFTSPPRSNVNTFSPKPKEKRGWSYYMDLKKKDPLSWMDKKIAIQMEKDAREQGEDFYKN